MLLRTRHRADQLKARIAQRWSKSGYKLAFVSMLSLAANLPFNSSRESDKVSIVRFHKKRCVAWASALSNHCDSARFFGAGGRIDSEGA